MHLGCCRHIVLLGSFDAVARLVLLSRGAVMLASWVSKGVGKLGC